MMQEGTQDGTRICSVRKWDSYHHWHAVLLMTVAYDNVRLGPLDWSCI